MERSPLKTVTDPNDSSSPKKRPEITGINGFYEDQKVEVASPMRKKKKGGLVKLSLNLDETKDQDASTTLQKQMDQILAKLEEYRAEFNKL